MHHLLIEHTFLNDERRKKQERNFLGRGVGGGSMRERKKESIEDRIKGDREKEKASKKENETIKKISP